MKKWLGILALIPCLANAQTYSSVSAGTGISISSSGAISNTTPIVSCANNEIVLQNASGSITCDPTLQWSISSDTLSLGNGAASIIQTTSAGATSTGASVQINAASSGSTSGAGGALTINSGSAVGTTNGNGGTLGVYAGSGSNNATTGNGNGGAALFEAGTGSSPSTNIAGTSNGGALTLYSGAGGNLTTTSNGGNATLKAQNGGTNSATASTSGGTLNLVAGAGGAGYTTANGGNVSITAGTSGGVASTSATGGNVTITAGSSNSSSVTTGTAGSITLKAGLSASATSSNGSVLFEDGNTNVVAKMDGTTDNWVTYYGVADGGIDRLAETTGFSYQIPNNVQTVFLHATGTLATGTLTLPTAPANGQLIRISADQTITSLTITPSAGQSTAGSYYTGGATLTATAPVSLQYCTTDTEWYVVH